MGGDLSYSFVDGVSFRLSLQPPRDVFPPADYEDTIRVSPTAASTFR